MKKLLLLFVLFLFSASAAAGLKVIHTADGHTRLERIEGYVDPKIEAYRESMKDTKPISDDEYLRAHKAELRELIEKSHQFGTRIKGTAGSPQELDRNIK
jgi:hypothetical protein